MSEAVNLVFQWILYWIQQSASSCSKWVSLKKFTKEVLSFETFFAVLKFCGSQIYNFANPFKLWTTVSAKWEQEN